MQAQRISRWVALAVVLAGCGAAVHAAAPAEASAEINAAAPAAAPVAGPVRLLVGAAPGSVMDGVARQVGEALAKLTGQPVVVDNRPSAGGIQALETLTHAAPDGRTLGLVHAMQMSVAPTLFQKLPYDTLRDFTHVGILFSGPQVLVVHPAVRARTWTELQALLKAQPERYRYATPGNGSPQHVTMELIKSSAGVSVQHIAYRGPAATTAVLGGEVEMMLEGVTAMLPFIRAGTLRPIALGGTQRLAALPDVPTFAESGVPGVGAVWIGVVAPPGLPADVTLRLNGALARAMVGLQPAFERNGRTVAPGSPQEMTETIRRERPVWEALVQRARIEPD